SEPHRRHFAHSLTEGVAHGRISGGAAGADQHAGRCRETHTRLDRGATAPLGELGPSDRACAGRHGVLRTVVLAGSRHADRPAALSTRAAALERGAAMTPARRFARFNLVGALGIFVQVAALALLIRLGVHYLAATAMAVSLAVVHNFWWHRRWTWSDADDAGR